MFFIFFSPRLLPPGCNLKLVFSRQRDDFVIMAKTNEYKVKIKDLQLSVRKVKVAPTTVNIHNDRFRNGALAIYPFHQAKLVHFTIPANVQNYSFETLDGGQLPQQIFVAFTDEDSFSGKLTKNPYHFKHYNLSSFVFKVNGENFPTTGFFL